MTTTHALEQVTLLDPVYTIETVAKLFHVSVDTARQYSYRDDFPAAYALGSRLLWDREDVLAWFRSLPRHSAEDRRRTPASTGKTADTRQAAASKPYRRRTGDRSAA